MYQDFASTISLSDTFKLERKSKTHNMQSQLPSPVKKRLPVPKVSAPKNEYKTSFPPTVLNLMKLD